MESREREWFRVFLIVGFLGIALVQVSFAPDEEGRHELRAISHLKPEIQNRILEVATSFGTIHEVVDVWSPKVISSHTRYVNVWGVDEDGFEVVVGVNPTNLEVVKMVKLCQRQEVDATEVEISMQAAEHAALEFLSDHEISIPRRYLPSEPKVVSLGPWKRWRFVWRHFEDEAVVLPDFIMIEVNATAKANIVAYSKVHHEVSIGVDPNSTVTTAFETAKEYLARGEELDLIGRNLAVVYPYGEPLGNTWQWVDEQALCWILRLRRANSHVIEIWVDALTGEILRESICHDDEGEVHGIDHPLVDSTHMLKKHLDKVWLPYLEMMKFDLGTFLWTNSKPGTPEATLTDAITNEQYFLIEAHGDVTDTAEKLKIGYRGTDDVNARSFTPDEVPPNSLRLAYLGACKSGYDAPGPNNDFNEVFINQGTDVFIGFDMYDCPEVYEESLLPYLAKGFHLANAHSLAIADALPPYSDAIVITYKTGCLNKVRLAPVLVDVERNPPGDIAQGAQLTVIAHINNRDDFRKTAAQNVKAKIIEPDGFALTAGTAVQDVGTVNWNTPAQVQWILTAPASAGTFTFDVEVWSDNLGVQVADPGDPFHKFDVNVP